MFCSSKEQNNKQKIYKRERDKENRKTKRQRLRKRRKREGTEKGRKN
jgi:hypothetical protein